MSTSRSGTAKASLSCGLADRPCAGGVNWDKTTKMGYVGFHRGNIRKHGKENGNYYSILGIYTYIGRMEKKMEATLVYWGTASRADG